MRLFDLKRPIAHATQRKLLDTLLLLDIWDLRYARPSTKQRPVADSLAAQLVQRAVSARGCVEHNHASAAVRDVAEAL